MKKLRQLIKDFSILYDIINSLLGIALIVLLILIFRNPHHRYVVMSAFAVGGLMNVISGLKIINDPMKKNMGVSFILLGIILIFIGVIASSQAKMIEGVL